MVTPPSAYELVPAPTLQLCNFTHGTKTTYKTRNFANATLQLCNFTYATLHTLQNIQPFTKTHNFATLQMQLYNFAKSAHNFIHFTKTYNVLQKRTTLQLCNFTYATLQKARNFAKSAHNFIHFTKRATLRLICKHFARTIYTYNFPCTTLQQRATLYILQKYNVLQQCFYNAYV